MVFLWILVSLIVFSIIVIIHEYGHYKTAKIFGIHVEEFGLGIPPRAKKLWKNKDGTLFSLNWIPLWGFVKIAGESEISPCKKNGKNFYEKNIIQKTLVLLAGVIMNFLLAGLIFSLLFMVWVKPIGVNTIIPTQTHSKIIPTLDDALTSWLLQEKKGIILYPLEHSLAQKSGIQPWDILIKINGQDIEDIQEIQHSISKNKNTPLSLTLERNTEQTDIMLTPNSEWKIGTYLAPNIVTNEKFVYQYGIGTSIKYGFQEMYIQSRLTLSWVNMLLKKLITPENQDERKQALEQVSGPIGIVSVITQSLGWWISLLCILAALISINLGIFNLLPIPALDGGRIFLLWIRSFIELFIGKTQLTDKIENLTHVLFFLLLIALSVLIAYNDINKIFHW